MILRKIIELVATIRCHILRLKCTKFDFVWGSTPDPTGGAYSAPPDPLAGFKGPTSKGKGGEGKGKEGRVGEGGGRGEGEGRAEEGREREGEGGKGRPPIISDTPPASVF